MVVHGALRNAEVFGHGRYVEKLIHADTIAGIGKYRNRQPPEALRALALGSIPQHALEQPRA